MYQHYTFARHIPHGEEAFYVLQGAALKASGQANQTGDRVAAATRAVFHTQK